MTFRHLGWMTGGILFLISLLTIVWTYGSGDHTREASKVLESIIVLRQAESMCKARFGRYLTYGDLVSVCQQTSLSRSMPDGFQIEITASVDDFNIRITRVDQKRVLVYEAGPDGDIRMSTHLLNATSK